MVLLTTVWWVIHLVFSDKNAFYHFGKPMFNRLVGYFNWFLYSIINRSQYQLFSIIPSFLYFIFHSLDRSLFCLREKVSTNQNAPSIQMMTHIKLFLWANYIIYTQLFYVLCWHTFSELTIRNTPYLDVLVNTLALSYPRGPHCTVFIF